MDMSQARVRKGWLLLWGVCVLFLAASVFLSMRAHGAVQPLQWLLGALDLIALYGLFGYAVRRPIRHLLLRLLYLVLSAGLVVRGALVLYTVAPLLLPWTGASEQYVSLAVVGGGSVMLLLALALALYATSAQQPAKAA